MKQVGASATRFCKKPDPAQWAFLLFGDDEGVIADASLSLRTALSGKRSDTETISLDQDQIKREPALLFDALEARSLLGNERLIRVAVTGDKISALLIEAIKLGEDNPDRFGAKLIITAGILPKRSKLRAGFEAAKHASALQFFSDNAGDLRALTRTKLTAQNVDITEDALALFTAELPGHRGLANQEIEKLALYGHKLSRPIDADDVRKLSTVDADHALHELISATLGGEVGAALSGLDRLTISGTSPIAILRALQRETTRLMQAHALAGSGGEIGMKLKPPVFKQAWPAFRKLMSLWPPKRLTRILERVYECEAGIKAAGPTGNAIIRKLINELSQVAAKAAVRA